MFTINVHNRSIPTFVETIIEKMDIEPWEKVSLAYRFFCAVFDNAYLNPDVKNDLLVEFLDILTYLREANGGEEKKKVLLLITKHDVLLNENKEKRIGLFQLITESLLRNNRYADDPAFVGTISEIFRAFFFYIYLETETLTKEYRDDLLELYRKKQNKKDSLTLSFSHLIAENHEKVIYWLAKDAAIVNRSRRIFWDYFSPTSGFKAIVWSSNEMLRFAFCFYKLIGYTHSGHPFVHILELEEYDENEKMAICRVVTDLYDNGVMNSVATDIIHQLEDMSGIRAGRNDNDRFEHAYFQDKLTEYQTKKSKETLSQEPLTDNKMLQLVNEELQRENVFALDERLRLRPATKRRIEPSLVIMNAHQAENSAHRISQIIRMIMNDVISRKLEKVNIDFGKQGIQTLSERLMDGDWQYRNYTHINDYAIPSALKDSNEFKKLSEIINGIRFDSSREITSYIFFRKSKVPYNLNVHYHLENPGEEKCTEFVKRHQIADGVFQIGSSRFDYSHAIKFVRQNYKLEVVDFLVRVDIQEDSGFSIHFEK